MSRGGILLMWRAVTDMTVENDEGRTFPGLVKNVQRMLDPVNVIRVADAQDVPAVTQEPGGDVLRKGDARVSVDGDVVVVINPAEVVQGEMAREGRGFRSHPFHHAAIAADRISIVVEDLVVRPIVAVGEPFFGHGHADAHRNALSEGAGRGLDAGDQMIFGVTGSLAAELAE